MRPRSHRQKENRALRWENSAAVLCLTALRFADEKKVIFSGAGWGKLPTERLQGDDNEHTEIPDKLKKRALKLCLCTS